MSILYFGLIAALIFGLHRAALDLHNYGVRFTWSRPGRDRANSE
jgi:hypothetical protein